MCAIGYAIDGYKDDSDDTGMKDDLKEVVVINDYKDDDNDAFFYYIVSVHTETDYWADQGAGVYNPCAAETFDLCLCDPSSCEGETPREDPPCNIKSCPAGNLQSNNYQ